MLFPKKVKFRKWHTLRRSRAKQASPETRGITLAFGSYALKSMGYSRVTSNEIEAARKILSRFAGKTGKVWTRIFPDMPFTQKPPEVKLGRGKGDPVGYVFEVRPGRVLFEVDGVEEATAKEALRKAGTKLSVKTKIIGREITI
jgi:large subunit ribosomal protein L16